jgi:hypothetical protein
MDQSNQYYDFYFKLAYTCQTKIYSVNLDISIKNFIEDIKYRARVDFQIGLDEDIDIIEAGNPDNINGHDAELAPALEPSNITIREFYENKHKNTAFYIRKIQRVLRINIPENVEINNDDIPPPIRRGNSNRTFEENV